MAGHSYEEGIKKVYAGLILLAVVTLIEVFFSLLGKGHIFAGLEDLTWVAYVVGFIIIALSVYKAYFIIYEFMHMRYEAKGLAMTVLLPMLLLVWAIIAFFQEGSEWNNSRELVNAKNSAKAESYYVEGEKERVIPTFKKKVIEEDVHNDGHHGGEHHGHEDGHHTDGEGHKHEHEHKDGEGHNHEHNHGGDNHENDTGHGGSHDAEHGGGHE